MKKQGDIKIINEIEGLIKGYGKCRCIKVGAQGKPPVRHCDFSSELFSRVYEVYVWPYLFVVSLRYDGRSGIGRVEVREKNIERLYVAIPGMVERMALLEPMSGDGMRTAGVKK